MHQVTPDEGEEDWTWYCMIQHFSAPTRLLDWSDGALMALHFAVNGQDVPDSPRVFVLDSYALDKKLEQDHQVRDAKKAWRRYLKRYRKSRRWQCDWYDTYLPLWTNKERHKEGLELPACPMLDDPDIITRRLAAQRSRFMLFGRDPAWLRNRHSTNELPIVEIRIRNYYVEQIRLELRDAGITESVIYPDLDGLGREMGHEWKARRR
jgi:hypothetical protein